MDKTKWLYRENLGAPLAVGYLLLLAKPIENELVLRGYCRVGNELCTGGLGLLIFGTLMTRVRAIGRSGFFYNIKPDYSCTKNLKTKFQHPIFTHALHASENVQ